MAEHDYEVSCECGAQWRLRLEYDDDAMATCLACGADTFELMDLGEVLAVGRDMEWSAPEVRLATAYIRAEGCWIEGSRSTR